MFRRTSLRRAAAAAVAAGLVLTACGSGSGDDNGTTTLTIQWWGSDERADRYRKAIKLFEKENPDIKVKSGFASWDDYWTARNTEAAGGSLPDVLQMDLSYLRQYVTNNQLSDLGEHVDKAIDLSGFEKNIVKSGQVEESQYAVPTGTNTLALHYNPDILQKFDVDPPETDYTYADYNKIHAEVSEQGTKEKKKLYGGGDYAGVFWFFIQWMLQEGIEPFTEDGELGFTKADMKKWLATTKSLREPTDLIYPQSRQQQLLPKTGFTSNEAAFEFDWDNMLAGKTAETGTDDLQLLPMPSGSDGEKHMFFKPAMMLSMSANTSHPEESAKLIDFLVNEPEVGEIFGTDRGVPASGAQRDALETEEGGIDDRVMKYEEAVSDDATEVVPLPVEAMGVIETEFKRLGEEFSLRKIDEGQYVDRWFSEAESALQN